MIISFGAKVVEEVVEGKTATMLGVVVAVTTGSEDTALQANMKAVARIM
jgi:hypothetical protein